MNRPLRKTFGVIWDVFVTKDLVFWITSYKNIKVKLKDLLYSLAYLARRTHAQTKYPKVSEQRKSSSSGSGSDGGMVASAAATEAPA